MDTFPRRCVAWALKRQGMPYIWGGKGETTWTPTNPRPTAQVAQTPEGYDCSGLVASAVLAAGGPDVRFHWSAQTMWDQLPATTDGDDFALVLYGKGTARVTHVAIELGRGLVLEAAGGDQTTRTYLDAMRRGASVSINFETRSDRLGRRSLIAFQHAAP